MKNIFNYYIIWHINGTKHIWQILHSRKHACDADEIALESLLGSLAVCEMSDIMLWVSYLIWCHRSSFKMSLKK